MRAFHEGLSCPYDLLEGNDTGEGSVLYESDDLVGHRRYDALDHLQQSDLKEDLAFCHAKYEPRFFLTDWDALDPAPVYFGKVACIIQDK